MEITTVRGTKADERLKQANEDLLKRVDALQREVVRWRAFAAEVRSSLYELDSADEAARRG